MLLHVASELGSSNCSCLARPPAWQYAHTYMYMDMDRLNGLRRNKNLNSHYPLVGAMKSLHVHCISECDTSVTKDGKKSLHTQHKRWHRRNSNLLSSCHVWPERPRKGRGTSRSSVWWIQPHLHHYSPTGHIVNDTYTCTLCIIHVCTCTCIYKKGTQNIQGYEVCLSDRNTVY